MKDREDIVDNLFNEKLNHFEPDQTPDSWNYIRSGVQKQLFFKFEYDRFNIYYLAGIITLIGGIVFFLFKETPAQVIINSDSMTVTSSDSIEVDQKDYVLKENRINNESASLKINNKNNYTVDTVKEAYLENSNPKEVSHNDTSKVNMVIHQEDTTNIKKNAPLNKVVYVHRRDTIVQTKVIKGKKKK